MERFIYFDESVHNKDDYEIYDPKLHKDKVSKEFVGGGHNRKVSCEGRIFNTIKMLDFMDLKV